MMKEIGFVLLCLLIFGCQSHKEPLRVPDDVFWVNLSVDEKALIASGYEKDKSSLLYEKRMNEKMVTFQYLPSSKIIFDKMVVLHNFPSDSLEIENWITENKAVSMSDWEAVASGAMKKYVRSRENGFIFSLYKVSGRGMVYLLFPDIGDGKRMRHITFEVDGRVVLRDTLEDRSIEIVSQPGIDW
jgi:hypothetical protein